MSRREPGYRPEPKLVRVVYDDHPGLVVRARTVPADVFMTISGYTDKTTDKDDIAYLFSEFAKVLISWNLEYSDDEEMAGELVPTTVDGLMSRDFDLVLSIVLGWMEAVGGVSVPLDQRSIGGSPSLVESLPMEPLSVSQVS